MSKKTYACSPRYRIYPTKEQRQQIDTTLDAVRFVYNHFFAAGKSQYRDTGEFPNWLEMQAQLPALKADFPWLRAVPHTAIQIAVQHLGRAFQNYKRRKAQGLDPGKLRSKSCNAYQQSYRSSCRIVISGNRVKLPKIRNLKICCAPDICGRIVAATVTREGRDRYYISFCYVPDFRRLFLPATKAVGIDLGLHTFAVTSDGEKYDLHLPDLHQPRLKRLYERLRRQTTGSNRWQKTYQQIQRLRRHIDNQRRDAIHKLTAELVRKYGIICIESLNQQSMMQQNEYRARLVRNSGWSEFRRQLEYKCEKRGRLLIAVNRYFPSSQLCSACGHRWPGTKRTDVREWTCPACGARHDRDLNAAINILHEGLRLLQRESAA